MYFKVTLNSQLLRTYGHLKIRNLTFGHLVLSRSQSMWLIWLKLLPGNTLVCSPYVCKKSRHYVQFKIVFEAQKTTLRHFASTENHLNILKKDKSYHCRKIGKKK